MQVGPAPATPLIGRAVELRKAEELLGAGRMLTLVGPAGCGKTRLALELRAVHGAGIVFVDLAPLRDPAQVLPAVARTLDIGDAGAQPLAVTLYRHLRGWPVLLVLDNFEHLLDAARDLAEMLAACPDVRVLATSRAPLQITGEQLLRIDPLPIPDLRAALPSQDELAATSSVALFVARVRAEQPDFALSPDNARMVAEICVALDGLPLALELAAARVRTYGLDEVQAGARNRFALLRVPRRAVPDRHRSLTDALRWSVDLLDEPTQRIFAELSVFAGGWTADAARAVSGPDVLPALAELVDHSLVIADANSTGVRYRMLESMREYAAEMLGDHDAPRQRHLAWCIDLAEQGADAFRESGAGRFDRADAEFDNFQAALDGCRSAADGLRLATALAWFWDIRGHLATGRAHLEQLLAERDVDSVLRGRALAALGRFAMNLDDHATAHRILQESVAVLRTAGDRPGLVWTCTLLTISAAMSTDPELAQRSAAEALTLAVGGPEFGQGQAWFATALARWSDGDHAGATAAIAESLLVYPLAEMGAWANGRGCFFRGWFTYLHGDDDTEAERLQRDGALLLHSVGDRRSVVDCLDGLGCLAARRGDPAEAVRLFAVAHRIRAVTGMIRHRHLDVHAAPVEEAARAALGPGVVGRLEAAARRTSVPQLLAERPAPALTGREFEVAHLVADGLTNRQIGRRLGISERTAERHVENLRAKLGLASRTQVAAWVAGGVPTRSR